MLSSLCREPEKCIQDERNGSKVWAEPLANGRALHAAKRSLLYLVKYKEDVHCARL